jgi:hypothetical protein
MVLFENGKNLGISLYEIVHASRVAPLFTARNLIAKGLIKNENARQELLPGV